MIVLLLLLPVMILSSSCVTETVVYSETSTPSPSPTAIATGTDPAASSQVPAAGPAMKPADVPPPPAVLVYDAKSARKDAPYGDSYDINRLERPFLQDMKYEPDLDILSFSVSEDADWYYVSIHLAGNDPNNRMGIDYGVELDTNADGYGDTLIWAYPPYDDTWTTDWVQVYNDANHDSAGASSAKADGDPSGNGYETLIFDGRWEQGADPSLAWVRMQAAPEAEVQFAFKKSLAGPKFLVGVVADGGLKKVSMYDYNDHFAEADAGSPLKSSQYYPLNALYAVDNTCWQAVGMKNPLHIAKVCPAELSAPAARPLEASSTPGNATP
jgi:hypothetical protein